MSEIVLSAFLSVIFEKLASTALEKLAPYNDINSEVKKLQRSLYQIQDVLADASQKEITIRSVKRWLNDLQHLAYDIDDILDDIATEAIHREFTDKSEAHTSKVRKFFSNPFSKHSLWTRMMKEKINDITTKLQDLIEDKATLGLVVKEETKSKNIHRRLQTSIVHASSIVGRQAEKETLIHQLLLDEPCDQNFSIVPIVGMGGVGKTTLARLLYDEKQVKDHFQLKAWVCVSDEFDNYGISKVIFQSVAGVNKEFADLNLLQVDLKNHLREKRFLLVLDDVWSESYDDWETLVGPFHACAPGSKIIMTTRKHQLLKKLGYNHLIQQLQSLSNEDALSLVAIHALGVNNFDSHLSLKKHGEGIVKKCDGLPLALVALGRLLRTKHDEEEYWEEVLNSEIWRLQDVGGILPALILSYNDLSAHLKQLFAYCSLFPKDFLFNKEELVQLWMAEGFLPQLTPSDSKEERFGQKCFDELLSRSFFQPALNNKSLFVMHDLMNDLATSVGGEFFLRLKNEMDKDIRKEALEKYHHMSFVREEYVAYKQFEVLKGAKRLRTFLTTPASVVESWQSFYLSNKILVELLPQLPSLRVLRLTDFGISEVPESIGTLRHLRYLNLSRTAIRHLPENVCNLYNLQTLNVAGCCSLAKLPNNFLKLKNLRHLDISDTPRLDQMPLGIDELKSLQTLSKIIIGGESGFEINKLKDFKNLCGKISIVGLDKVQNAIQAREASFSQKRLGELEAVWSDVSDGSRNEMLEEEILNELKPHTDYLKQLRISSYGALKFPNWVADPSFLNLKHVSIRDCKKCTSLPPLGQLPSLKKLFIEGLEGVEVVGQELLGTGLGFTSLEILGFVHMPRWEKWSTNIGVVFPCLKELLIVNCPNLSEVSLEALPSLKVVRIIECDSSVLRRLVHIASPITKLEIESIAGLNDVVWKGVIEYLGSTEILIIRGCNEIRYLWESAAVASKVLVNLRTLHVLYCGKLVRLGEKEENNSRSNLLTSLRVLNVRDCHSMVQCSSPDSVEYLAVWCCTSITTISLPTGGRKLTSTLWISGWPNLKSIVELNYLVHLTNLRIESCECLESFPDNELPGLTSLLHLGITNCPSMDASFPRGFWPPKLLSLKIGKLKKPISEWGPQNFPTSLFHLTLYGEDVSTCSQFSRLLPSSLTSLKIDEFEKLESFSTGLRHLTSLEHLHFFNCPNLMDLPDMLLPSLLSFIIRNCPNLIERCSTRGCYWPLISDIPCIDIPGGHLPKAKAQFFLRTDLSKQAFY
ncbi:putative P-loop containing nucleoside triphosphate hydrolase, leucine-rich repeat domain superfamily [Helianthus annuus]|nr:putative P-loop containing nucleoside triphosphate hydrolase, leucine-rich repeat domain superfamily [Helianthus annuus]